MSLTFDRWVKWKMECGKWDILVNFCLTDIIIKNNIHFLFNYVILSTEEIMWIWGCWYWNDTFSNLSKKF